MLVLRSGEILRLGDIKCAYAADRLPVFTNFRPRLFLWFLMTKISSRVSQMQSRSPISNTKTRALGSSPIRESPRWRELEMFLYSSVDLPVKHMVMVSATECLLESSIRSVIPSLVVLVLSR